MRDELTMRLHNGEFTERELARRAGLSQPHVHNALSGKRSMTPAVADKLLAAVRLSILDLIRESID